MTETIREEFALRGVFCAGCTPKIEKRIKKLDGVSNAYVDFVTSKLIIEIDSEYKDEISSIKERSKKIAVEVEPGIKIIDRKGREDNEIDGCCNHEHCSHHDHNRDEMNKKQIFRFGIGAVLFFTAIVLEASSVKLSLYIISYLLIGGEVVWRAAKNITRGQVFDENFLMALATIGAFGIQEYSEAVAVMFFYQIGELFQGMAVNRSRKSISELMDIRPDYANLKNGSDIKKVSPEEVGVNDMIVVKPGEKVPLDGVVSEGKSTLDTSALTGEAVPRTVDIGSEVLSGFINTSGLLTIKVTKKFGESTVSKILDLVENAGSKKAPTENFITKFAKYYTPAVVISSLLLAVIPPLIFEGATFSEWLSRALIFLVISCPCALVISIPLGFFGGIGAASKNGILVKGGNYLEALNNVDTIVFDKTGTLTKGIFQVSEIHAEKGCSKEELLEYAAYAESYSSHPIAKSVLGAYGKEVDQKQIVDYQEISGHGIKAVVKNKAVFVGNVKLMRYEGIPCVEVDTEGSIIHVGVDKQYLGYIIISDQIKEDTPSAIADLKRMNINKLVMLTGDNKKAAESAALNIGLDQVYSELLPDEKVKEVERLEQKKASKKALVFVGDGINDAPVLARADVGVAMGGLGSDAAIEAADIVLMTDEPSKLVSAVKIAKYTRKIVWQNIIFALGVKGFVLLLGAFGFANMWEAVFADVGVALIAVLNSMRVTRVKEI